MFATFQVGRYLVLWHGDMEREPGPVPHPNPGSQLGCSPESQCRTCPHPWPDPHFRHSHSMLPIFGQSTGPHLGHSAMPCLGTKSSPRSQLWHCPSPHYRHIVLLFPGLGPRLGTRPHDGSLNDQWAVVADGSDLEDGELLGGDGVGVAGRQVRDDRVLGHGDEEGARLEGVLRGIRENNDIQS